MSRLARVSTLVVACLVLVVATGAAAQLSAVVSDFALYVNGQRVNEPVLVINGSSYLPVRAIGNAIGAQVGFDSGARRIDLTTAQATDTPTTPSQPSQPSTPTGTSRSNPAKIGDTLTVERDSFVDGKASLEITLTEVIRGSNAWTMVEKENVFNNPPKDGMEYVLAKFKVKLVSKSDQTAFDVGSYLFEAVSESGSVYTDDPMVVPPQNLRSSLYVGAEHEGYICLMVNQGDDATVAFDRDRNSSRWFSLQP